MNAHLDIHTGQRMVAMPAANPMGGEGVDSELELMLEDAHSIREGLWRIAHLAQDAAEAPDGRMEDENLIGMAEAVEVREALEHLQTLSIEVSEELDAYQTQHAR
jgi:hypothetical protein